MLHEADLDLWCGDQEECKLPDPNGAPPGTWAAVLHACKAPCHQTIVGYRGSLPSDHPEYLWAERDRHLALNMIDAPDPRYFLRGLFEEALDFVDRWHSTGPVLIHCNQGLSRSPALAMLYLAKRQAAISRLSFADARADFERLYKAPYAPSSGLAAFLETYWRDIL